MVKLPENWKELAFKAGFARPRDYPNQLWAPFHEDEDLSEILEAFAESIVEATQSNVVQLPTATPQVTAWMEIAKTFEAFRNGELKHCDTSALVASLNRLTAVLLEGK